MIQERGSKIGRFMIAVGAVIEDKNTGNILLSKRTDAFQQGTWEITYGRIDQFEDLDDGLKREVAEETGLGEIEIITLLRIWHIFRGEETADKEVFGFTFYCQTASTDIVLSSEHSEFRWVSPQEALGMIEVEGIRADVQFFIDSKNTSTVAISDKTGATRYLFT